MSELNTVSGGKVWSPYSTKHSASASAVSTKPKVAVWEQVAILALYVAYVVYMFDSLDSYSRYASLSGDYAENDAFLPTTLWNESIVGFHSFLVNMNLTISIAISVGICIINLWRRDMLESNIVFAGTWLLYSAMAVLAIVTVVLIASAGNPEKIADEWAETRYGYTFLEERKVDQDSVRVLDSKGVERTVSLHVTDEGMLLYEDEQHLQEQLNGMKNG